MNEVLLNYGVAGVGLIVLAGFVRVLFNQNTAFTKAETARADRNEDALRELNRSVRDQVVPAALEMVAVTKDLIVLLAQERTRRGGER